jgi:hypothetical protein
MVILCIDSLPDLYFHYVLWNKTGYLVKYKIYGVRASIEGQSRIGEKNTYLEINPSKGSEHHPPPPPKKKGAS